MRYINNRYTKQDMRRGHTVGAAQLALKIRKRRPEQMGAETYIRR